VVPPLVPRLEDRHSAALPFCLSQTRNEGPRGAMPTGLRAFCQRPC
jgi:hypothetical protein